MIKPDLDKKVMTDLLRRQAALDHSMSLKTTAPHPVAPAMHGQGPIIMKEEHSKVAEKEGILQIETLTGQGRGGEAIQLIGNSLLLVMIGEVAVLIRLINLSRVVAISFC